MEVILDKDGKTIRTSRNLRGIRRHVSENWVKAVHITQTGYAGALTVAFGNGDDYTTKFASFDVLKNSIRNWRNLYGARLVVNGEDCGLIAKYNVHLKI
jgi:hypothetical protein